MVNEFDNTKMGQVTAGNKGNGNELECSMDKVVRTARECTTVNRRSQGIAVAVASGIY